MAFDNTDSVDTKHGYCPWILRRNLKFSEVASPRPSSAGSTDLDLHQLVRIGYEDASGFANHPVGVDLGALLLILATFRNGRLNFRFFQEVECLLPRNCCYTGCYCSICYNRIASS